MAPKKLGTKRGHSVADNSEPPAMRRNDDNSTASALDFSRLPDNVLKQIIQNLPKAQWPDLESVNHKFQAAVHGAWKSVREIHFDEGIILNEKEDPLKVLNSSLEKLLLRALNIKVLDGFTAFCVRGMDRLGGDTIDLLAGFGRLECIRFDGCRLGYLQLARLLETSKSRSKLKELTIDQDLVSHANNAWNMDHEITELKSAFSYRADLPPLQLETFKFSNHRGTNVVRCISDMDVTRLSTLCYSGYGNCQQILISLVNRCTSLRRLEFSIYISPRRGIDLDRQLLLAIAASPSECLSSLKTAWQNYHGEFETALVDFIGRLGNRRNPILEFSLQPVFSNDDGLKAIADYLPNLKALKLDARWCSTPVLKELLMKLERLEKLTITCDNTDPLATSLVDMANLEYLDVLYHSANHNLEHDFIENLSYVDQLKELRMVGGDGKGILSRWSKNGCFPHLESLTLGLWDSFGTRLIVSLLKEMPELRRLNLAQSGKMTDTVLHNVAKSCPLLEELDVSECIHMTQKGIEAVVKGCKKLKKIKGFVKSYDKEWARGLDDNKYKRILED